jgi:hypothetical protein
MLHILLKRHEYLQDYTVSELERSKFESKRKCVLPYNLIFLAAIIVWKLPPPQKRLL